MTIIKDKIIPAAPGTRVIEVYLDDRGEHREWHHYVIAWLIRHGELEVVPIVADMEDGCFMEHRDNCHLAYPAPDGTYNSQGVGNIKSLEDISDGMRHARAERARQDG